MSTREPVTLTPDEVRLLTEILRAICPEAAVFGAVAALLIHAKGGDVDAEAKVFVSLMSKLGGFEPPPVPSVICRAAPAQEM